jgi:uncharacterized coiled-coil protein SlyX
MNKIEELEKRIEALEIQLKSQSSLLTKLDNLITAQIPNQIRTLKTLIQRK